MKEQITELLEETHYGINNEQQGIIRDILKFHKIEADKKKNINYLTVKIECHYFGDVK